VSVDILRKLRPAFKKNYSKLLINECVIPETGANSLATALDLVVLPMLSSGERREKDWELIIQNGGFKVTKIWTDTNLASQSVIEAELDDSE
jgi:hypothetical protein